MPDDRLAEAVTTCSHWWIKWYTGRMFCVHCGANEPLPAHFRVHEPSGSITLRPE